MRLGIVTARALITGMGRFRNVLRDPFIQPAGNPIGIESMKNEMNDLVPKDVPGKFLLGIAKNEQAALRMDPIGPLPSPQRDSETPLPPRSALPRSYERSDICNVRSRRVSIALD